MQERQNTLGITNDLIKYSNQIIDSSRQNQELFVNGVENKMQAKQIHLYNFFKKLESNISPQDIFDFRLGAAITFNALPDEIKSELINENDIYQTNTAINRSNRDNGLELEWLVTVLGETSDNFMTLLAINIPDIDLRDQQLFAMGALITTIPFLTKRGVINP
jgi:hypothetical protein